MEMTTPKRGHVGRLLREWRNTRRLSQLALALEAGVSARHLSYVETGKARPSRDMITRLAGVLAMPLRELNSLLVAGGFAPRYPETPLGTPELERVRGAIDLILEHQEPYPALVIDRYWEIVLTNRAAERLHDFLCGGSAHTSVLRRVFDPDDVRPTIVNWEEVAGDLVRHLHEQVASSPTDERSRALLEEVLRYPDVPPDWRKRDPDAAPAPLLTLAFQAHGTELRFFSTITTFGAPRDVTLEEIHIECWFPADDGTTAACRSLARREPAFPPLSVPGPGPSHGPRP